MRFRFVLIFGEGRTCSLMTVIQRLFSQVLTARRTLEQVAHLLLRDRCTNSRSRLWRYVYLFNDFITCFFNRFRDVFLNDGNFFYSFLYIFYLENYCVINNVALQFLLFKSMTFPCMSQIWKLKLVSWWLPRTLTLCFVLSSETMSSALLTTSLFRRLSLLQLERLSVGRLLNEM